MFKSQGTGEEVKLMKGGSHRALKLISHTETVRDISHMKDLVRLCMSMCVLEMFKHNL